MSIDELRALFLKHPGAWEDMPFGETVLVFKVATKMFGLLSLDEFPTTINCKCDPARAEQLREQYASIVPGYHQNKKHWNTMVMDGELSPKLVAELITHSYDLVVASLPRATREELKR